MEFKRFGDVIYLRVDRGEEVLSKILEVVEKEHISLGTIEAIGACDKFTVGLYSVSKKQYFKTTYEGEFEIVSFLGNVTTKDDKPYIHVHIACADDKNNVKGGHLNECYISATFECKITIDNGKIGRHNDETTGLNLFKF